MLQAIENLTKQKGEDVRFVIGPPPPEGGDSERPLRLFAVFVGLYEACDHIEAYWDFDPTPGSRWDDHICYGAEHLDKLQSDGFDVVLAFDPDRCDHAKLVECGYWSTENGTPEREQEAQAHADVFPDLKEDNLYLWRDVTPGQFLELIEQKRGARIPQSEGTG